MTELKENQLEKVAGGSSREKSVTVRVDYSNGQFTSDITIKAYLDKELYLTKTVSYLIPSVNITVKGVRGMASLKVKINDEMTKEYVINFDDSSYKELD